MLESKSTFIILIVVVAILTLSLAALAGYIFIVQGAGGSENPDEAAKTGEGAQAGKMPDEDELVKIPLFTSTRYFNLKSEDPEKPSIIQVNVTLKCYKTLKNDKKANVEEMIAARSEEIQELVIRYFMTLTRDQVKDLSVMDETKARLAESINALLNEGAEKPEDIVYKVIFSEWLFQ